METCCPISAVFIIWKCLIVVRRKFVKFPISRFHCKFFFLYFLLPFRDTKQTTYPNGTFVARGLVIFLNSWTTGDSRSRPQFVLISSPFSLLLIFVNFMATLRAFHPLSQIRRTSESWPWNWQMRMGWERMMERIGRTLPRIDNFNIFFDCFQSFKLSLNPSSSRSGRSKTLRRKTVHCRTRRRFTCGSRNSLLKLFPHRHKVVH